MVVLQILLIQMHINIGKQQQQQQQASHVITFSCWKPASNIKPLVGGLCNPHQVSSNIIMASQPTVPPPPPNVPLEIRV